MEFWDREKEIKYLKRYIQSEPNAILFVYGPKSSGKSTLLMEVAQNLPKDQFVYYWYDLRERVITGYDSVLRIFFRKKGWLKRMMESIPDMIKIPMKGFEFDGSVLKKIFKMELDAFEEMRAYLEKDKSQGKTPVIVFDELQKLKEVYLNSPNNQRSLVRELFNFFIRLTKVLHLSHVIVMTSDTFFIERVYTDSTLKNTSIFYEVDFFNGETAFEILKDHGFSDEDAKYVVEQIGGVPWMLERVILENDPKRTIEDLYNMTKGNIDGILGSIFEEDEKFHDEIVDFMKRLLSGEFVDFRRKDRKITKMLVEKEILYYDPIDGILRFQTKLDERAAREILKLEC